MSPSQRVTPEWAFGEWTGASIWIIARHINVGHTNHTPHIYSIHFLCE